MAQSAILAIRALHIWASKPAAHPSVSQGLEATRLQAWRKKAQDNRGKLQHLQQFWSDTFHTSLWKAKEYFTERKENELEPFIAANNLSNTIVKDFIVIKKQK